MSRAHGTLAHRRLTVAEYHRMAAKGVLRPDERVELIRGVIREMSPKNRGHVLGGVLSTSLGRRSIVEERVVERQRTPTAST